MGKKNKGKSEYDLNSIFVEIYKLGYEAGTTPLTFATLCTKLPSLAALTEGPVKDSIRLWFHQQFMTPLWLHLQYGGSGSPGSKALIAADGLEGVMSGEAVIAYMGYRKYEQAGRNAVESDKHARFAMWTAIVSIVLAIISTGISIFPKEVHDRFYPSDPDPILRIVPLLEELLRQHQAPKPPEVKDLPPVPHIEKLTPALESIKEEKK
ncbi:MAG: hypothetical protein JNN32_12080 [Flavobacteriales bacterium]|nr:hypothetical protein [Flavobacteriales bacterium]